MTHATATFMRHKVEIKYDLDLKKYYFEVDEIKSTTTYESAQDCAEAMIMSVRVLESDWS